MTTKKKRLLFNWMMINPENWRGPGLSFPISADLVMVPEFDELVIAAVDTFPDLDLVDPDEVTVFVLQEWERGDEAPQPFGSMGPSDLGLRLHYMEGEHKEYVLKLRDASKPVEVPFRFTDNNVL